MICCAGLDCTEATVWYNILYQSNMNKVSILFAVSTSGKIGSNLRAVSHNMQCDSFTFSSYTNFAIFNIHLNRIDSVTQERTTIVHKILNIFIGINTVCISFVVAYNV